ncbi:MAG: hypothetical protein WAN60_00835 [Candidatus Sulfotelmatobacter sp.]
MKKAHSGSALAVRLLLLSSVFFLIHTAVLLSNAIAQAQPANEPAASAKNAPLPAVVVVENLQRNNALRAAALTRFEGTRVYRVQYRGFPSDHDAEMVVHVAFHAPSSKEFTVVSQTGSKFIGDHIFKKLLEGEQEAANEENRRRSALSTENYDFTLSGYEDSPEGGRYVLDLLPKTKNKFLYRGKIWVDANDFAVVRIEAEPAKNPSFWIKKTDIRHKYIKVDGFWLPAENHSESLIRLGGKATLSIEYRDYKIVEAAPLNQPDPAQTMATAKPR